MGINPKQINQTIPMSMQAVSGSVSVDANSISWYPKIVSGIVELFVKNAQGQEVQVTKNGSLNLPVLASLNPSGGSKDQVLAKVSPTDFAYAWKSPMILLKEFSFSLPIGADLTERIDGLVVSGLELSTASNHTPIENEFGTDADTLVVVPTGMANVVLSECIILEKTITGAVNTQGWKQVAYSNFKGNTVSTKGALLGLSAILNPAKEYLVYIRFLNPSM